MRKVHDLNRAVQLRHVLLELRVITLGVAQKRYACPSSSIHTVGSMSSQLILVAVVMSLLMSAEPRASVNGPVGLSDIATPMALPWMVACSNGAYQ